MKSSIRNFIETNLIMLGLLFYCCEDTQPDSSDIIDGDVVINEINYNSLDSFDPDDWVEIYNSSNETIDLGSWLLKDDKDDHIFTLQGHPEYLPSTVKTLLLLRKDIIPLKICQKGLKKLTNSTDSKLISKFIGNFFMNPNYLTDILSK